MEPKESTVKQKKAKKEIERPLIYFIGKEVKTVSLILSTPVLVLYGCSDGSAFIDNIHSKEHLASFAPMKNSIIHSAVLKKTDTVFLIILQDRMGIISISSLELISPKLSTLCEFNTEAWTFTKMAVSSTSFTIPEDIEIAMPSLSSAIHTFSINGKQTRTLEIIKESKGSIPETGLVTALLYLDNGKYLVSGYENGEIAVWLVGEQKLEAKLSLPKESGNILTFEGIVGPSFCKIYVGVYGTTLYICQYTFSAKAFEKVAEISEACSGVKPGISDIKFRTDQQIFFTSGYDYRVRCYSSKSNKLLAVLKYHTKNVNEICTNENKVIVCSDDGCLTEWELY